jgi:hypothetical protein
MSISVFRSDRYVQDGLGNAIAGASVAFCSQPANTTTFPPSPLIQLYSDNEGNDPITNPLTTDGLGHAWAYMAAGSYTVVIYGTGIATQVLQDQTVTSPTPVTFNNDSSNAGTITGAINGTNVTFVLSAAPAPASTLLLVINGLITYGWTLSGATVTLPLAPHAGSLLNAIYQTAI